MKTCLIDADGLLFAVLPKKEEAETKSVESCVEELNSRIKNICKANNTSKYILFFTGSQNFRKRKWKYSSDYKLNRKNAKVPPVFKYLQEYCYQKHNGFYHPLLEADDLVSYTARKFGKDGVICSPDKDVLYQNVGMHYNYRTGEFIEITDDFAELFLYKQIGMGDAGDGVSGIQGVGEKTIDKWFKNKKSLTYAQIIINAYIEKYGIHEGFNRFYESFTMVYLLNTEKDMLSEIGELPKEPIINDLNIEYDKAKSVY